MTTDETFPKGEHLLRADAKQIAQAVVKTNKAAEETNWREGGGVCVLVHRAGDVVQILTHVGQDSAVVMRVSRLTIE